jgi:hypothetical protein
MSAAGAVGARDAPTQVFTERLPGVCVPHARHTERFADVIQWIGYALGGRGGERLLSRLGVAISDDTIVGRQTRRTAAQARRSAPADRRDR